MIKLLQAPSVRSAARQRIVTTMSFIAPNLLSRLLASRARRHVARLEHDRGIDRLVVAFTARYGQSVIDGPFKGLMHTGQAAGSMTLPKLIGSYEAELHASIEQAIAVCPSVVIDVGAAEGYYAIGLARRLPHTRVLAFDTDPVARRLCSQMARFNNVDDRVSVQGQCNASILNNILLPGALVVSDCEGYEQELLDPARAPLLGAARILVELHERVRPGVTADLLHRFEKTHSVSLIDSMHREPTYYRCLDSFNPEDRLVALDELRHGPQQWAVMVPIAHS